MKNGDKNLEMVDVSDFASDEEGSGSSVEDGLASATSSSDVDGEYGERTLRPTTVTEGSQASKHEFYRAAVRRQNCCFGAGVFAFAGLFAAAYFLMGLSFSPSVIGIFGDELSMKGGSGEVGLDASNAETQEIVDEEVAEIEKAGHWGDMGAPSGESAKGHNHMEDMVGHNHVGKNKWTEEKGWWKDHAGHLDESHMTKRQKHKFEKMKKKQAQRMKEQEERLKRVCKKRPNMPRCQGKQDTDIDSITEKLSHHYNYEATGDPKENSPASDEPIDREGGRGREDGGRDGDGKGPSNAEGPSPDGGDGPVEEEKGGADDEGSLPASRDAPIEEEPRPDEPSPAGEGPDGEGGGDSAEEEQNESKPAEPSPGENGPNEGSAEVPSEPLGNVDGAVDAVGNGEEPNKPGATGHDVDGGADEGVDDVWEYDWMELTDEQKDAAKILEFDEAIWDNGGKSRVCLLSWDDLNPQQQHAATLLGQDRAKWDEEGGDEGVEDVDELEEKTPGALPNAIVNVFKVLDQVDHDPSSFTQGLSYGSDGTLFETTGLYRQSKVRQINPNTFDVELSVDIDNRFFGEGSTVYTDVDGNERLIEITWKEQTGFIYDTKTLEKLKEFKYTTTQGAGNEGWGITYDASKQEFIVSDGSQYLYIWDRDTLEEKRKVTVTRFDGSQQNQLNELEYMDGHVCMNIWHSDDIICVDPMTGKTLREYDMSLLWPRAQRGGADVLNGIALGKDHVLLTGKRWDRMYKVVFPDWPSLF